MNELVRFTSVVKAYSRHSRVSIQDLSFAKGEHVLVSGANGSGKSTLLRLLAGVSVPTAGVVWRAGEWARARIGYVPQSGGLYDDISVSANFDVRAILHGSIPARDRLVERLALSPWLSKRAGDLSGGYRRVVAMVAALAVEPDVLILDEPFDGLDDRLRQVMTEIVAETAPRLTLMVTAAPGTDYTMPALDGIVYLQAGQATWLRRSQSH